jgi:hypothetical protein
MESFEKVEPTIEKKLLETLTELELKDKRFHYVPPLSQKKIDEWKSLIGDGPVGSWDEEFVRTSKETKGYTISEKDKETQSLIDAGVENWTCGYKPPETK